MTVQTETIEDGDSLYRRFFSYCRKADGSVSSSAYKNKKKKPDPEPSVDLARLTTPQRSFEFGGLPGLLIGELPAAVPLALDFAVVHDPDHSTGNMAHCLIVGNHTKTTCYALAEATTIVYDPAEQG